LKAEVFSGLQAIFLHPFDPSLFLFSVKKKTWSALEQLSCPFFHPTFNRPNPSAFTPALAPERPRNAQTAKGRGSKGAWAWSRLGFHVYPLLAKDRYISIVALEAPASECGR